MSAPVPLALRELMILTKCYCGNYGEDPHPRLGHNCSFRRDVETVVAAVQRVLALCEDELSGGGTGPWDHPSPLAEKVHAALLGLPQPVNEDPPWDEPTPQPSYSAQVAERLQRAEADRRLSEEREGPSGPG